MFVRKNVFFSFLISVAVSGLLVVGSFSEINPDWFSYKEIYESGGAWLLEQNRDLGFLAIVSFSDSFFEKDGYFFFRVSVAVFFIVISVVLSSGMIIKFSDYKLLYIQFPLALISFEITRFTIQIREGIAISFLLLAFACFNRFSEKKGKGYLLFGFFLAIYAVMIHSGTVLLSIVLIVSIFSKYLKDKNYKVVQFLIFLVGFSTVQWVAFGASPYTHLFF